MEPLPEELQHRLQRLGIEERHLAGYQLPFQQEQSVIDAGRDIYDRPLRMSTDTYSSWLELEAAAAQSNITIQIVSGFRSFNYQCQIIQRKRETGESVDDILRVSAIPGFSEHHSGRALDLTTPGHPPLEESFEKSSAFAWLMQHAQTFGFAMSYPRGNRYHVAYEPWHWCWHPAT
ncbi:MAG: M15 family metallopeptidase [Pseudomonadota bacterium]